MAKNISKHALTICVKKDFYGTDIKTCEEKSFDIENGKCEIEIGGSFEIFVKQKLVTKIILLIQNIPLKISQIVEIEYGNSKKFNTEFSNFGLECTLRYGE